MMSFEVGKLLVTSGTVFSQIWVFGDALLLSSSPALSPSRFRSRSLTVLILPFPHLSSRLAFQSPHSSPPPLQIIPSKTADLSKTRVLCIQLHVIAWIDKTLHNYLHIRADSTTAAIISMDVKTCTYYADKTRLIHSVRAMLVVTEIFLLLLSTFPCESPLDFRPCLQPSVKRRLIPKHGTSILG